MKRKAKRKVDFLARDKLTTEFWIKGTSSVLAFDRHIQNVLAIRKSRKIIVNGIDYTPNLFHIRAGENILLESEENKSFWFEVSKICNQIPQKSDLAKCEEKSSGLNSNAMNVTIDDLVAQIAINLPSKDGALVWLQENIDLSRPVQIKSPRYIKVVLKETGDILLFDKPSITVLKRTKDALVIEEDNRRYDYLTAGKGRNRRLVDVETQTINILYKTRQVNTERIKKLEVGTYVSNYDMFDTYAELEFCSRESGKISKKPQSESRILSYDEKLQKIVNNEKFQLATMVIQRLLAGNVFREKQKRYRNMFFPDPLSGDIQYLYKVESLWCCKTSDIPRRSVASLSWCQANADILAVAYGTYSFIPYCSRTVGYVCVWSIKNPINPERKYQYIVPVTAVAFSKKTAQLLAVGLYNGSIEIRDISGNSEFPIAKSQVSCFEPIFQIEWVTVARGDELAQEQLLSISQDGSVIKHSIANGSVLDSFLQMKFDRIEGVVEGLKVKRSENIIQAYRHSQAFTIAIHPEKSDIYYVGTDDGCLIKCSTNYPLQHSDVLQVHDGGVYAVEFSPFSGKIFLSCGSDWNIRVWLEGIFEPLIQLSSGIGPIYSACWSPVNSTIIIGVTRNSVEIWDLRRSLLKPASSKYFGSSYLSIAKFSNCGRSLVVGDEDGRVHMCALENMPFPPRFQYEELETSILKALTSKPDVLRQVQSLGFFGRNDQKRPMLIKNHLFL